eukprot:scaffold12888_cov36-Phaeocystis_antarctica.AAC.1
MHRVAVTTYRSTYLLTHYTLTFASIPQQEVAERRSREPDAPSTPHVRFPPAAASPCRPPRQHRL